MKEEELLPGTQTVIDIIWKVKSNPKDAAHGKNKIDLYRQLTKEEKAELKQLKYLVEDVTDGSSFHKISWKE